MSIRPAIAGSIEYDKTFETTQDAEFGILEKRCTKCQFVKSFSEFPVSKINKDGRHSHCLECRRKARKAWGSDKRESLNAQKREWYAENREHALNWAKEYSLSWRYGISLEEYVEILDDQNGVCKICGSPPSENFALSVDHNHETGEVRGLLCGSCNFMLGHAKDKPELLRKAAQYLEEA